MTTTALFIVDVQNDFCPGGSLAIPNGDEVVPYINSILDDYDTIVVSRDWHQQGVQYESWPSHCVQGTWGAQYHPDLALLGRRVFEVLKGDGELHPYGAFYMDNNQGTLLPTHEYLQQHGVTKITVVGLATDYCVKTTVLDALSLGYEVELALGGCRGLASDTTAAAIDLMVSAGAVLV